MAVREADAQGQVREVKRIYDLSVGKYDLTVRSGPSFTSRRDEAATQMIELIRAYPAAAPVIGDLLARNLDWPGADEIAQRLSSLLPAQLRGEAPELGQARAAIETLSQTLAQTQARLDALQRDRAHEARRLEIEAFEAETNRLRVTGETRPAG